MNISQAKDYIKNSINIYLKKDEFGDYRIPVVRQRPIFLLGAPGIGKTAIMEQIAQELGIALVSYSMTHHTRQSALGLPFIKQKEYGGRTYDISEYTMSEIISSVYETMEESGVQEGILFLDEINCVSETLAPSMLQFLQYKVFGKHKVPEGWVIVTAGNPPEYNKSVREFDVVTMDRLKVLEVEADYATWRKYAQERNVHSAVLNFLAIKKEYFYHMETSAGGRSYVTARGWEDLSQIIQMYEADGLTVDESLVSQYLRNENIVKEFCAYYDLYNKYKKEYQTAQLLNGEISLMAVKKAGKASIDERLSLLGLLIEQVQSGMNEVMETSDTLKELLPPLRAVKEAENVLEMLKVQAAARETVLKNREKANSLSDTERRKHKKIQRFLQEMAEALEKETITDREAAFAYVKTAYDSKVLEMKEFVARVEKQLHYLFTFTAVAFSPDAEALLSKIKETLQTFNTHDYAQNGDDKGAGILNEKEIADGAGISDGYHLAEDSTANASLRGEDKLPKYQNVMKELEAVEADGAFDANSNEMLVLVTELTLHDFSSSFISTFGSEDYQKYNQLLMVTERQENLKAGIVGLLD